MPAHSAAFTFALLALLGLLFGCDEKPPTVSTSSPSRTPSEVSQSGAQEVASSEEITRFSFSGDNIINPQMVANDIANVRIDGSDLVFDVTGRDPHFSLPRVPPIPTGALVEVDLTLPDKQMVQLFFEGAGEAGYTEKNSVIEVRDAGRQKIEWRIPAPCSGMLRLDPGSTLGEYRVHAIRITP